MNPTDFDDETLMAHADGVLEASVSRQVAEAAARDPAIAARIELFRQTGALLGAVAAARPAAPLSDALSARIAATLAAARAEGSAADRVTGTPASGGAAAAPVLPFAQRPRAPAPAATASPAPAWRTMAMAASVALLVGAVGGVLVSLALRPEGSAPAGDGGLGIAALAGPGLVEALGRLPAGARETVGEGEVAVIASFLTDAGTFCREFEYGTPGGATVVTVACHEAAGWETRFAVVAAATDADSYAPASSLDTLDAYLEVVGAGAPLSPEEEARRLADLRR